LSRVILDEGVPRQVGDHLPRHSVTTVPIEGWASVKNGTLLALIEEAGFSAFISADKNLDTQQSLRGRPFATLLLSTNHWPSIRPNVGKIAAALDARAWIGHECRLRDVRLASSEEARPSISIRNIEESAWKVKAGDAMVWAESERCPVW
jgi:hypothetical protein